MPKRQPFALTLSLKRKKIMHEIKTNFSIPGTMDTHEINVEYFSCDEIVSIEFVGKEVGIPADCFSEYFIHKLTYHLIKEKEEGVDYEDN
jgi:hypothetical protein